jgi:hypothetical protein
MSAPLSTGSVLAGAALAVPDAEGAALADPEAAALIALDGGG